MIRFVRFLIGWLFGFRAFNEEVLRTPGPVLLLPNHTSWIDWLFLLVCADEDWKCVVSKRTAQSSWLHRLIMVNARTFPIDTDSPFALKHMADFLAGGGRLVLFPEGRLSRTGTLMKIFDGTGFLLHKTGAKVITCYLRGAHRLPGSPNPNLKKWRPVITAHFSQLLTPPKHEHLSAAQVRARFTHWLRGKMVDQQFETEMAFGPATLVEAISETALRAPSRKAMEDVTGALTYRRLLIGADLMASQLDTALSRDNPRVGVLLPNVCATPLLLLSLWVLEKEPAIFNYSTDPTSMLGCARLARVTQIVTSRMFLERAKFDIAPLIAGGMEFIYMEDLRAGISGLAKLCAFLKQTFLPGLKCRARRNSGDTENPSARGASDAPSSQAAVILFTSGSEGVPKGVELTHANMLANVRQMLAVTDVTDADRLFNAMPLFHSFGLTVGLLLPLLRGMYIFIYPSPLHYRVVPTVFYDSDCTVMIGTNTFLNGYARKANPYDFRSLRYMFSAAEKLQESTATAWAQRFGVRVLEGYGATECSPCISVNTPLQAKYGSAGQFMPGMQYKLEAVDGVTDGGRLFVSGPNVMKGYLQADSAITQSPGDWYDTGDIVRVDEDGFIFIQGRLKRFAKISGEMVSLTAVEDALAGAFPQYGLRFQSAVLARPDEDKGEKLVVLSNDARLSKEDVRAAIKARGLSNIAVPKEIIFVENIPKLGTGKVNYRELEKRLHEQAATA